MLRGQDYLEVTILPLQVFYSIKFGYGGMSASSFAARTVANPSTVASASSMMADAVSRLASLGITYPDDTLWRSML